AQLHQGRPACRNRTGKVNEIVAAGVLRIHNGIEAQVQLFHRAEVRKTRLGPAQKQANHSVSCSANAGHPVTTASWTLPKRSHVVTGSPAFAGDDTSEAFIPGRALLS